MSLAGSNLLEVAQDVLNEIDSTIGGNQLENSDELTVQSAAGSGIAPGVEQVNNQGFLQNNMEDVLTNIFEALARVGSQIEKIKDDHKVDINELKNMVEKSNLKEPINVTNKNSKGSLKKQPIKTDDTDSSDEEQVKQQVTLSKKLQRLSRKINPNDVLEYNNASNNRTVITMTVAIKPFEEILRSFELSPYCKWLDKVREYYVKYPSVGKLSPGNYIDIDQKKYLIRKLNAKHGILEELGGSWLNIKKLESCSMEELTLYITILNRPPNAGDFNKALKNWLEEYMPEKYGKYLVQLGNFSQYFFAVIVEWFDKFKFFYELLSVGNDPNNIPTALKNKTNSMVEEIIIKGNPLSPILKNVWLLKIFPIIDAKGTKNTITIIEINNEFLKLFREWLIIDDVVVGINNVLRGGDKHAYLEKVAAVYKQNRDKFQSKTSSYNKSNSYNNNNNRGKVMHINGKDFKEVNNDSDDNSDNKSDSESLPLEWNSETEMMVAEAVGLNLQDEELAELESLRTNKVDISETYNRSDQINNFNDEPKYNNSNNDKPKNFKPRLLVCGKQLFTGACLDPKCQKDHTKSNVLLKVDELVGLLQKTKASGGGTSVAPSSNYRPDYNSNNNNKNFDNHNKNYRAFNKPPPIQRMNVIGDVSSETGNPLVKTTDECDSIYLDHIRNLIHKVSDKSNISNDELKEILRLFIVKVKLIDSNGNESDGTDNALADVGAMLQSGVIAGGLVDSRGLNSFLQGKNKPFYLDKNLEFVDKSKAVTKKAVMLGIKVIHKGKEYLSPQHEWLIVEDMSTEHQLFLVYTSF